MPRVLSRSSYSLGPVCGAAGETVCDSVHAGAGSSPTFQPFRDGVHIRGGHGGEAHSICEALHYASVLILLDRG